MQIMFLKRAQPDATSQEYIVNSKGHLKHAVGTLRQ